MFNWDDLRFFIAVTRAKSLSAAATKLGMNHTTVARRIQALEESLAVRLFDKTPAGYVLTPTGAQLLKVAEHVETTCISAQEMFAGENPTLTGTVRLSVPEGFGSQFLTRHLGDFYKNYPGIDLEIMALPHLLSISKREADLAVTLFRPDTGRLITRELTDYTMHLYGTREYVKRAPPINSVDDLKKHSLISNIDDLIYSQQMRYLDETIPDAHVRLRIKGINAQLTAVESGVGLAILPYFMAVNRKNFVAVLPDKVTITRSVWLAMHEDMRHVGRVMAVWDWIKQIVIANRSSLVAKPA